ICGRIFLHERLWNFLTTAYEKTVTSTASPSPSPSSTVSPAVAINDGGAPTASPAPSPSSTMSPAVIINDGGLSTATPAISPSSEERIAKSGVQTNSLPSGKNAIGTQAKQPERKGDKEPQSIRTGRTGMVQWSGRVSGERVVKIDLPGVPLK